MQKLKTKKLTKYIASTGVLATSIISVNADIIYTDINPDHEVGQFHNTKVSEYYDIILDGDTMFRVGNFHSYYTWNSMSNKVRNAIWIEGVGQNQVIADYYFDGADTLNDGYVLNAFSTNNLINETQSFQTKGWLGVFSYEVWSTGSNGAGSVGGFGNTTDKYVGVKFQINSNSHFGWLRFTVGSGLGTFSFYDYAYQDCPNIKIKAGDQSDVKANTLDLGINALNTGENPADIEVSFSLSVADSTVSGYRLIAVKESKAATFSASMAKGIPSSSYISVGDSIISFSQALSSSTLDSDGDAIAGGGEGYRMFALSLPDGKNSNSIEISLQSDLFLNGVDGVSELDSEIELYKSNNVLTLNTRTNLSGFISVFSIDGKMQFSNEINTKSTQINTETWDKGIYIIQLTNESGLNYSKKIIL